MAKIIVLIMCFVALFVDNVHAYIDFGAGSYVLQVVAASAIGFLFLVKSYLQRIKQFFFRKKHYDKELAENIEGQK